LREQALLAIPAAAPQQNPIASPPQRTPTPQAAQTRPSERELPVAPPPSAARAITAPSPRTHSPPIRGAESQRATTSQARVAQPQCGPAAQRSAASPRSSGGAAEGTPRPPHAGRTEVGRSAAKGKIAVTARKLAPPLGRKSSQGVRAGGQARGGNGAVQHSRAADGAGAVQVPPLAASGVPAPGGGVGGAAEGSRGFQRTGPLQTADLSLAIVSFPVQYQSLNLPSFKYQTIVLNVEGLICRQCHQLPASNDYCH